jgi:hypothetical protein
MARAAASHRLGQSWSSSRSGSCSTSEIMASIPEYESDDSCHCYYTPAKLKITKVGHTSTLLLTCSDFKAAESAGLCSECGSQLCDAPSRLPDHPCDGSWSATEDADPPGQALRLDPPQACRSPSSKKPSPLRPGASVRITLHNAPADKGLAAVASVEHPEDGSPCRLRICRGAATLALFVLDGKSISISLVSAPSFRTTHPGIPRNASGWIKVSCEGGGDMYACAALGWRALMPFLYPTPGQTA